MIEELNIPVKDSIHTIFGPSGIGKTHFVYQLIKELDYKKFYIIDTEKGFCNRRLKQIVKEKINNIELNYFQILDFNKLNEFLRKFNDRESVLIVDSISMPYRLELKDDFEKINKELAKTLHILLQKAENNIIFLIAHSYYNNEEHKIVGGDLVKYYSKVLIEMFFEGNKRKIKILKHKYTGSKELKFKIDKEGIKIKKFF